MFNISFTPAGNFSRVTLLLSLTFLVHNLYGQGGNGNSLSIDSIAISCKKNDNIEAFAYGCLDLYLANTSEENLDIFELYERHRWRKPATPDESIAHVILLCNKGFYLTRYGNIYQGIDAYERAWKMFDEYRLSDFDIIEYCLKPLGNNYSMLGDYVSAGNVILTYLHLAERQNNYDHLAAAALNLSVVHHDTGNHLAAIEVLSSALATRRIPEKKIGIIYGNLARNYQVLNSLDKAGHFARLAISNLHRHQTPETPVYLANAYKIISLIHLHKHDTSTALRIYENVLMIVRKNKEAFKTRELAKVHIGYAGLLKVSGNYDSAIKHHQRALQILLPSYQPVAPDDLPSGDAFYAENAIKESLDELAGLHESKAAFETAVECYKRSFIVEDLLRDTYNYQGAKLQQQIENRNRAGRVIHLLHQLSEQTGDCDYIKQAFQVAERTKSIVLREMAEDRYAKHFASNDTLVQHERQLRFKQATITSELALEQRRQPVNDWYIRELVSKQTRLTLEIKSAGQSLEKKYPQYRTYHKSGWLEISDVQMKLRDDNALLIEYFADRYSIFQFIVTPDSISMHQLTDYEKIKESVATLNELFSRSGNINNNLDAYKETASLLFRQLQLGNMGKAEHVVLIPDGLLYTIPFDALLYEKASGIRYDKFPYLVRKYIPAYYPSALLYTYLDNVPATNNTRNFLGMFPVFENTDQVLSYTKSEAENIRRYFTKGTFLMHEEASKKAFIDNASRFSVIHLSTHAFSGNHNEPPAIAFRDSALYLPQIYGLHLNTDLMVLSACETGVGQLVSGEGALSLAHAFQYAGARSIILSLWKVNDQSTAMLFSSFYKRYTQSGNKAASLQKAKIDYLESEEIQNTHKSPFYWAAFVYYGDHTKTGRESSLEQPATILAGILLVMALAGIAWKMYGGGK